MNDSMFNLAVITVITAVTIIATGISIYNSASSAINESVNAMSQQEIAMFNNQFEAYEGSETGSTVKALIGVLIANANTYQDETPKIPTVTVVDYITTKGDNANESITAERPSGAGNADEYIETLGEIRTSVEEKHTYTVKFNYSTDTELIEEVEIYYEEQ